MRELRDAARHWARTPVITSVVVLSLALGIGANTAIFSLVDAVLLKSLPVHAPERLVRIGDTRAPYHGIPVWRLIDQSGLFESTAAMSLLRPDISETVERRSAFGLSVSGTFFDTLGVRPAIGRLLTIDDDRIGAAPVTVVDHQFWLTRYGGRPDVLGATIRLDGKPFTIVGVTEPGFFGLNVGRRFDIAISLNGYDTLFPDQLDELMNSFSVIARLKPGHTAVGTEAQVRELQSRVLEALNVPANFARVRAPWSVTPVPGGLLTTTQDQYRRPLAILMALVTLVLVIACANVANLLLARSSERRGELAVRRSLGASRWTIIRGVLIDSAVIALAGAIAALVIGRWTAQAIVNAVAVNESGGMAMWIEAPLNLRVLAFTIAAGLATAVAFGAGPAWRAVRIEPIEAMRARGRGTVGGAGRIGIAQCLVALQVALSFMLVLGGGLLVRSFVAMTTQDLGFDRRNILVAVPDFSRSQIARRERVPVSDRIRERLRSVPGVRDAGIVESSPFGFGTGVVPFALAGAPGDERVNLNRVGEGYFRTIGSALVAGRDFDGLGREPRDSAIVNEAFAERYLRGRTALGQDIQLSVRNHPRVQVVGVVANSRHTSLRGVIAPTVFVPMLPEDEPWIEIDIRSDLPLQPLRAAVIDVVSEVAPGVSVEFRSIDTGVTFAASRDRVVASLAAGFAILSLLLSAIGLYGVMSHQVVRRRQEFGVRVAVGAAPASVTRMVLTHSLIVIAIGIVAGLAGAIASGRLIGALLYNVTPTDPVSIAAAAIFLGLTTTAAAVIPAIRASRVDPMIALRDE